MTNSQVIKNVISKLMGVKAREIKLGEVLSPEFVPQENHGHSWWSGAEVCMNTMYGYSFKSGLKNLDIKKEYSFSDNGDTQHEAGETISNYFERVGAPEFEIVVVVEEGKAYGENSPEYRTITLHKLPDFKSHWEALETADIERWQKWFENENEI